MKLGSLINPSFLKALHSLSSKDGKDGIPLRTVFKLKGIGKRANEELKKYDEIRLNILKELGEKDENGKQKVDAKGNVSLTEDAQLQFADRLAELFEVDVDLGTVKLSELGSMDKPSPVTASELMLLDGIVVED